MSALSSDVAGVVDLSIDQHEDSVINAEETRTADQAGDLDVEDEADQPVAKRLKVEDEKGSVKAFPTQLPMEYDYHDTMYYVRDCYPEYYELVMHLLDKEKKQGVTITGTPGVMAAFYSVTCRPPIVGSPICVLCILFGSQALASRFSWGISSRDTARCIQKRRSSLLRSTKNQS
jgi:hypothetical protein